MIDHENKEILLTIDLDKLKAIGEREINFLMLVLWTLIVITAIWLVEFA